MHFASYSADFAEFNPIRLGQHRLRQFGLQEGCERGGGKNIDESVAGRRMAVAERIKLAQRLTKKPRRYMRLAHPEPEIAIGDLDAGPQQDPLASALRRRRPYRLQDLLRFPEISGVVERNSITQRRMPRRDETPESRRHQRLGLP